MIQLPLISGLFLPSFPSISPCEALFFNLRSHLLAILSTILLSSFFFLFLSFSFLFLLCLSSNHFCPHLTFAMSEFLFPGENSAKTSLIIMEIYTWLCFWEKGDPVSPFSHKLSPWWSSFPLISGLFLPSFPSISLAKPYSLFDDPFFQTFWEPFFSLLSSLRPFQCSLPFSFSSFHFYFSFSFVSALITFVLIWPLPCPSSFFLEKTALKHP